MRALKAGAAYFAVVFAVGFVLGVARTLWIAPLIGERAAELAETPVMLLASFAAARWAVRRFALTTARLALLAGAAGLAFLAGAEIAVVLFVRGMSLAQYARSRDPVAFAIYLAALILYAAMPALVRPRLPGPDGRKTRYDSTN